MIAIRSKLLAGFTHVVLQIFHLDTITAFFGQPGKSPYRLPQDSF
jgi:hypothetical protein